MPLKLFLDDLRNPPDSTWTIARTADEAIATILSCPLDEFEAAMFDHDLGHCLDCKEECPGCKCRCHLDGYYVVCWIEAQDCWPRLRPTCHSSNPPGKAKIDAAIRQQSGIRYNHHS